MGIRTIMIPQGNWDYPENSMMELIRKSGTVPGVEKINKFQEYFPHLIARCHLKKRALVGTFKSVCNF